MDVDRFERYRRRLIGDLIRFGRNLEDAQDVVQEVMIDTLKHADRIPSGAEWAYLRTAAHRRAINQATRHKPSTPPGYQGADREEPGAEARLIENEERRRFNETVKAIFDTFDSLTRQIFILRRRGEGFDEIATKLNIRSTNARTRFSRAARILRERAGTPPDGAELPGDDDE